jgi:hypothetical protein
MGVLAFQLSVAGSYSLLDELKPPIAKIFPLVTAALLPYADDGIEALVIQVFSTVAPETGIAKIVDDAVRKTRTNAKAKVLLIATTSLLDGLQIKDFSYKTLD